MPAFVLDAFAMLAFLQEEPGAIRVRGLLERASNGEADVSITVVNFGEVVYTLEVNHGESAPAQAIAAIERWAVDLVEIDEGLALQAAYLKANRHMGYLDCFVVALAIQRSATILTGNPDFHAVEDSVGIDWLPQS